MSGNVCAIDPGVGGAIVFAFDDEIHCYKMPKTDESILTLLVMILSAVGSARIIIEKPPYTAGFNRPAARIAKLFENYSFIKGCLMGLGYHVDIVIPNEWQKLYKPLPKVYAKRKTAIHKAVCEQYPNEKITKYAADAWAIYHWYKTTKGA